MSTDRTVGPASSASQFPDVGDFCRHYKHDPAKGPLHKTYEIVGFGAHTETGVLLVHYRPLYEDERPLVNGRPVGWMRPISMFTEFVEVDDVRVQRFEKVTNVDKVAFLKWRSEEMYGK